MKKQRNGKRGKGFSRLSYIAGCVGIVLVFFGGATIDSVSRENIIPIVLFLTGGVIFRISVYIDSIDGE